MKIEITGTQTEIESVLFHLDQKYHRTKTNSRRRISETGVYRLSLHFSLNAPEGAKTTPKTRDVEKYPLPVPVAKRPRQLSRDEIARNESIRWARDVLNIPFLVYDFETTGKNPRYARPVSLAVINGHSKDVLCNVLLNPEIAIPKGASDIHHITDDMVADAPTFKEFYPQLVDLVGTTPLIAYNSWYDGNVIIENAKRAGLRPFCSDLNDKKYCAMIAFSNLYGALHGAWDSYHHSYTFQKLSTAASYFKLAWDGNAHHAAADALMTVDVIRAMAALDLVE
jgi:DNA polymerase-3 subunit epsilon